MPVTALAGAVLASVVASSSIAADLDIASAKDPLPESLTWHGITVFGAIDAGYAYQTNGRPLGGVVSNLEYLPFTTSRNYTGQSISSITASGLQQSFIGLKLEEDVGYGFKVLARADTGFDLLTGELTDGCRSILENAGKPSALQTSNADTSRCGQAFNGMAYAGLTNGQYGTLTVGRQNSLQLDAIAIYDPLSLSYAFSVLGYSGANGGSASTQAARWDNSIKYIYTYGPFHAAAMYSNGGQDTGTQGTDYGFNAGVTFRGFSLDGIYTKEHGAVNLKSANSDPIGVLNASISDNEAWSIMGSYTYDFGGGYKDEGPGSKLTLYAGYTHTDQANPHAPVGPGATTNGGYLIVPDNNAFTTDRTLDFYWTGAKYALPTGWSFTAAYYHVDQNSYIGGGRACPGDSASGVQCAGTFDEGSFVVDYQFNKHFDVYAGVNYGRVDGGLAANYAGTSSANGGTLKGTATSTDTTDVVTGLRLRF